jgi:hypothetical protein
VHENKASQVCAKIQGSSSWINKLSRRLEVLDLGDWSGVPGEFFFKIVKLVPVSLVSLALSSASSKSSIVLFS